MSVMLGVRRPGVTVAIQELEGRGLIRATRGEIVISDRDGLFQLADGTYSEPEREYERLLGKSTNRYYLRLRRKSLATSTRRRQFQGRISISVSPSPYPFAIKFFTA
ncbi:helix-turn-helix domain-containing protein [Mesorhizobium sp.]|uniref:helix-turn-helix domain-containing protein n=2 Tax=Mesorhizobium TaxID=68287 RepID=UPI0034304716